MKTKFVLLSVLPLATVLLQGCIAFPPLIQVERKDNPSDQEVVRRLDEINHRLDRIEQHMAKPAEKP